MTLATLLSWAVCGAIVGLIARTVIRGFRQTGRVISAILGGVGACAGVFLYCKFDGQTVISFSLAADTWRGWVISIAGATFVISVAAFLHARRWWPYSSRERSERNRRLKTAAILKSMIHGRDADAGVEQEAATLDRHR
jgi:uncharacterized membrane protein YeaQ/YmgE (transglycosylase-associated protein family)